MKEVCSRSGPSSPEGINKLHQEVSQMPMDSTSVTMPSAVKHAPIGSWGIPYDWLTEEEKTRVWFNDVSVHHAGTTQKWTALAFQPDSGTSLKDTGGGGGKSTHWAVGQAVHSVIPFV